MIHDIKRDVYKWIRQYGDLTPEQMGEALNKDRQIIWRFEEKGQMPTVEQEKILVEESRCTKLVFAEIACKALSRLTGRRVMVAPEDQVSYLPTVPLVKAAERYREGFAKLSPEQRKRLERKLRQARTLDSVIDQIMSDIDEEIESEIAEAEEKEKRRVRSSA